VSFSDGTLVVTLSSKHQQPQPTGLESAEVLAVPSDQREPVRPGGGGNERIEEGQRLAQSERLVRLP
jgi:hypothetical protein